MSLGLGIVTAFLIALIVGFIALYRFTRTPAWSNSDLRMTTMSFLITIGPMFGVRIKPDDPEPPAVMTPGPDQDDITDSVVVKQRRSDGE